MFVIGLYNSIDLGLNIKGLLIAVICIVIVILLVKFFLDYFEERKVDKILQNHKSKNNESSKKDTSKKNYKKMIPFSKREIKQGLTWGGGNIKGAIPNRGNKKEFLK